MDSAYSRLTSLSLGAFIIKPLGKFRPVSERTPAILKMGWIGVNELRDQEHQRQHIPKLPAWIHRQVFTVHFSILWSGHLAPLGLGFAQNNLGSKCWEKNFMYAEKFSLPIIIYYGSEFYSPSS